MVAEQLIQKERQLGEFRLARIEPDLFDVQLHQAESFNRELKKQLDEKQELLHEAHSHLSQTQNELAARIKGLELRLQASEQEKELLQNELSELKQRQSSSLTPKVKEERKTAARKKIENNLWD